MPACTPVNQTSQVVAPKENAADMQMPPAHVPLEHESVVPSQTSSLPEDFYATLQPPPDMDDLDNAMPADMMQLASDASTETEEEHHGMRRPTLDEFDALKSHPYVERIHKIFHTSIVDARLKI